MSSFFSPLRIIFSPLRIIFSPLLQNLLVYQDFFATENKNKNKNKNKYIKQANIQYQNLYQQIERYLLVCWLVIESIKEQGIGDSPTSRKLSRLRIVIARNTACLFTHLSARCANCSRLIDTPPIGTIVICVCFSGYKCPLSHIVPVCKAPVNSYRYICCLRCLISYI